MDIPVVKLDPEEKKVVPAEPAVKGLEPQKLDHKINRYFFLGIIIIFAVLLYFSLAQFFSAFLGAVIFYVLSKKRMDKLIKKGWKKPAAATFVILISLFIIIVPISIVSYLLYMKGRYYIANPDLLVQSLHKVQAQLQGKYDLAILSDEHILRVKTFITNSLTNVLNEGFGFVVTISMLYFFLYFMLVNINRMEAAIVFFLPFKREKIEMFGKELVALTYSNSIGVPAIALAQGIIGYIGYSIVGLPEAGFWAVMTGFASVVPLVGAALVWVPAAIYLFVINHTGGAIFLGLWGLLVIGVSDNVVRFMLAKKMADVHPIVMVLGVIIGLDYFGIAGLVFGPVLISYFIILLKIYYLEYQSGVPVIKKRRSVPIRFNLPFLGGQLKRKSQLMNVIEVKDKKTAQQFLEVNPLMNQSNPKYIRPLDNEVNDVFDPKKNKAFKYGTINRWILVDSTGEAVGRIAAFTHKKYLNKGDEVPVGGVGFFDCTNDQQAANLLFDTAKKWLTGQGMQAMDGPINFLDRDKWWGLMVEGFDEEPMYGISFNPPYYEQLFENYGFQNFYNQYYYTLAVYGTLGEKYPERHARFASKPDYSARHVEKNKIEKYAKDFTTIYNLAWAQHDGGKEITYDQAFKIFKKMKPIMDENLVWFAYYKEDPIGMWINIPDLNQYFKYFNGKFGLWQKLRLLWLQKFKPSNKINGVAFGIVPKFQALGIDAFMIYSGALVIRALNKYQLIEMGWAGEWNPRMVAIYKAIGGTQSRRMVTYRYFFNRQHPFERHPVVGV